MSIYAYRANNNICRDLKLHLFSCNVCGSFDLSHPHNSESDHRDVLRFKCNKCGNYPYEQWMSIMDVIPITSENVKEIKNQICIEHDKDPERYEFCKEIMEAIE